MASRALHLGSHLGTLAAKVSLLLERSAAYDLETAAPWQERLSEMKMVEKRSAEGPKRLATVPRGPSGRPVNACPRGGPHGARPGC